MPRALRVVVAPVMVADGVALGKHQHHEIRARAPRLAFHLVEGRQGEFRLALDARKQGTRGAFVKTLPGGSLVEIRPHPRAGPGRHPAVEVGVARRGGVAGARNRRVEARHQQALEGFRGIGGGETQHEGPPAGPGDRGMKGLPLAVAAVDEADSVAAGDFLRKIEDAVLAGLQARHKVRPGGKGHRGRGRRQRPSGARPHPGGEVGQAPRRHQGLDDIESGAIQGQNQGWTQFFGPRTHFRRPLGPGSPGRGARLRAKTPPLRWGPGDGSTSGIRLSILRRPESRPNVPAKIRGRSTRIATDGAPRRDGRMPKAGNTTHQEQRARKRQATGPGI